LTFGLLILREVRRKHIGIWLGGYLVQQKRKGFLTRAVGQGKMHVLFCMVDHFEPIRTGSTREEERARLGAWMKCYPELASRHKDSYGRPVQHTWFYPGEEYEPEFLDGLSKLCSQG